MGLGMQQVVPAAKAVRLTVFVAAVVVLGMHVCSGRLASDPLSPGSVFPALSYVPALPLTLLAFLLMALTARHGRQRVLAAAVAASHYLLCGDYAAYRFFERFERDAYAGTASIRVGAANVQYLHQGPAYVGRELHKLDTDVWLLSEFETSSTQEQDFLAQLPDYELVIGRSRDVAVLSRQPVLDWKEIPLPSHQTSLRQRNSIAAQTGHPKRSFLHVTIGTSEGPVHVIPLRFIAGRPPADDPMSQFRWGRYLLREQAREVDAFASYVAGINGPVIFGGDLNATHASVVVRRLRKIGRDVYLESNPFGDYTFRTFTPWLPPLATLRLDYLFATSQVDIMRSWRELKKISDHYPIIGDFTIGGY